jgi:outer membrane protein assembly factor BamB
MFQHDAQHSGRSDVVGPQGPAPVVEWTFQTRTRARAALSVAADGTVIVGNGRNPLSAVDADTGAELWESTNHSGAIPDRSQPAVSADGSIFIGARDNDLWKVADDGTVLCTFHVPHDGDVTTSPTIAQDGTVYMGSGALGKARFYSMNPDCTVKWDVILHGSLENVSPALSLDEQIVFVSVEQEAIALDTATGDEIWRVDIAKKGSGRSVNFSPVVANDGSAVYFNSREGLWALDPETGEEIWKFVPAGHQDIYSVPAIGADGTLYFGVSRNGNSPSMFIALRPDGTVLWQHPMSPFRGRFRNNQAAIGADGTIYVPYRYFVFAFDPAGDGLGGGLIKWQMILPGEALSGAVLGGDGVLYLGIGSRTMKIVDP